MGTVANTAFLTLRGVFSPLQRSESNTQPYSDKPHRDTSGDETTGTTVLCFDIKLCSACLKILTKSGLFTHFKMLLINQDPLSILPTSRKSVLLSFLCTHHRALKLDQTVMDVFNHVMNVKSVV